MEENNKYEIPKELIPTDENKYKDDSKKKSNPILTLFAVFGAVAVLFAGSAIFVGLTDDIDGADETVSAEAENTTNGKEEMQAEEIPESAKELDDTVIDAVLPGDSNYDDYIHVGNSYNLKSNASMDILNAWYGGHENGQLCVLVEFTAGDEPLQVNYTSATLYVDDYEYPLNSGIDAVASYGNVNIGGTTYSTFVDINASGRKGRMVFLATFPDNLTESSSVEFDIVGGIFKINPLSVIHANDEAEAKAQAEAQARQEEIEAYRAETEAEKDRLESSIGSMGIVCDGVYTCEYNSIGGDNKAYLEIMTSDANDETEEVIMIDSYNPESSGMPDNFSGKVTGSEDLGYGETGYIISDYNDVPVFLLTPTSKIGFNLEAIDENYREGITHFNGYYYNEEARMYFIEE